MFRTIYVEEDIVDHPRVRELCNKYHKADRIVCRRYTEVFNRKAQNFRLQKDNQALILAAKYDNFVLQSPIDCNIGGDCNYYFSHMLNCIYDCRYCFLRGMYRSGHLVLFVNYESFHDAIETVIRKHSGERCYFFAGYDNDSLALEAVTHFAEDFLPFFAKHPEACFEMRTKSNNIDVFGKYKPLENCVVAFSLSPDIVNKTIELKTPSLSSRIEAIKVLQNQGWSVGLRFDPIICFKDYQQHYRKLFQDVFNQIDGEKIHSVSFGPMRLPKVVYRKIIRLYPDDPLFVAGIIEEGDEVSYSREINDKIHQLCYEELSNYLDDKQIFPYRKDQYDE